MNKLPDRILGSEPSIFRENFNLTPFMFSHNLGRHPLFDTPHLVELGERLLKRQDDKVLFYTDCADVAQGWKRSKQKGASLSDAIANLQETQTWIMLKSIQEIPEYDLMLKQFLFELEEFTGVPLSREITWSDAYLFLSSPGNLTPYHVDHESNFLIQIHGEKETNLFNPYDRSILLEPEMERYYVGDMNAARYREENQSKAYVFNLAPGKGAHHPPMAPHWARTGKHYSVSLSIPFCMRSLDLKARVYQVNHFIRKLGMKPTPPGVSPVKDKVKIFLLGNAGHKPKEKSEVIRFGLKKYAAPIYLSKWIAHSVKRNWNAASLKLRPKAESKPTDA